MCFALFLRFFEKLQLFQNESSKSFAGIKGDKRQK